jgi:hypothetical protein
MVRMTVTPSLRMLTLTTLLAFASSPTGAGAQKSACGSEIHAIEINKATLPHAQRACRFAADAVKSNIERFVPDLWGEEHSREPGNGAS